MKYNDSINEIPPKFDQWCACRLYTLSLFTINLISLQWKPTVGVVIQFAKTLLTKMRIPEVIDLHPVGSVTSLSHIPCLAISPDLKYLLTCPSPLVPAIWKVADLRFSLRSLRGHKSPVSTATFSKNGDLISFYILPIKCNIRFCEKLWCPQQNRGCDLQQG